MDPAGPGFEGTAITNHLSASDADYVDVIHTDSAGLGMEGFGSINFYVNGGAVQPYCFSPPFDSNALIYHLALTICVLTLYSFTVGCAHYFSWRIYSESIYNSTGFLSKKCTDACMDTFPICTCTDSDTALIGIQTDIRYVVFIVRNENRCIIIVNFVSEKLVIIF